VSQSGCCYSIKPHDSTQLLSLAAIFATQLSFYSASHHIRSVSALHYTHNDKLQVLTLTGSGWLGTHATPLSPCISAHCSSAQFVSVKSFQRRQIPMQCISVRCLSARCCISARIRIQALNNRRLWIYAFCPNHSCSKHRSEIHTCIVLRILRKSPFRGKSCRDVLMPAPTKQDPCAITNGDSTAVSHRRH